MEFAELEKNIDSYRPNEEVLRKIGKVELLGTVGPTAVGKSTITLRAIEKSPNIHMVLSDVSRKPRPHERDGVNYYFRSEEEMIVDLKKRNFVQIRPPAATGDLYATRPDSYPQEGIGTLAIMSKAIQKFRQLPFKKRHFAFIVPSSYDIWQDWFTRQAQDSKWSKADRDYRLKEAIESFEFALDWKGTSELCFVLNDDLDTASQRLIQVSQGQLPDDHAKARRIAQENYRKLKDEMDQE